MTAKNKISTVITWSHCIDCGDRLTDQNRDFIWSRRCAPCVQIVTGYRERGITKKGAVRANKSVAM